MTSHTRLWGAGGTDMGGRGDGGCGCRTHLSSLTYYRPVSHTLCCHCSQQLRGNIPPASSPGLLAQPGTPPPLHPMFSSNCTTHLALTYATWLSFGSLFTLYALFFNKTDHLAGKDNVLSPAFPAVLSTVPWKEGIQQAFAVGLVF